jgi:hypothetical protein
MQIEFHPDEEWIELPQDSRYLISTHGRLYDTLNRRLVPLSTAATRAKVPAWSIKDSRPKAGSPNRYIPAARAVLEAFTRIAGAAKDHVPGYLDGDARNIRLDNLAWVPKAAREPSRV